MSNKKDIPTVKTRPQHCIEKYGSNYTVALRRILKEQIPQLHQYENLTKVADVMPEEHLCSFAMRTHQRQGKSAYVYVCVGAWLASCFAFGAPTDTVKWRLVQQTADIRVMELETDCNRLHGAESFLRR